MKRMKKSFLEKGRKIFSYLVITAMLFGMLPVNSMQAFAAGGGNGFKLAICASSCK